MTTPKQQQRVSALPAGKVSTVRYEGKIVLRISDCDQGPDPGWQLKPSTKCLQTGARGISSDDKPRFCQRNARDPSRSHSGIRWVRSPRGVIREFRRSTGSSVAC